MRILNIKIDKIKPYENNPRNNSQAVDLVANSIREFGFKVPLVIDKDNVIVTGHTRWLAGKKLGLTQLPCIRADDLSEDQIKAFRIADNKVAEASSWDFEKLVIELGDIDLDMTQFGLEDLTESIQIEEDPEDDPDEDYGWYGDERERTNKAYHLDQIDYHSLTNDFWQMPIIDNNNFIPDRLIGFNYAKSSKDKNCGIHFYVDDYQFERVWNYPEKYIDVLMQYDCILSPDFSLYMDMPMPMKIWNIYRSRWVGSFYQRHGIKVIPTISWAERETFDFCFQGIPKGSIVSISTVGVKQDKNALRIWEAGTAEMIQRIEPEAILVYGGQIPFDYGDTKVVYFENQVTEDWKERAQINEGCKYG